MTSQNQKKVNLANQIARCERKLEELKSKYIMLFGYCGLKMNDDGSVSEMEDK